MCTTSQEIPLEQRLRVVIPLSEVDSGEEIVRDEMKEAILANQSKFYPLFARIIDVDDSRVQIVEDSVEIEEFVFDQSGDTGQADVKFMTSYYAGCKDMDSDEWHYATLPFDIVEGKMVFDIDLPIRWRVEEE